MKNVSEGLCRQYILGIMTLALTLSLSFILPSILLRPRGLPTILIRLRSYASYPRLRSGFCSLGSAHSICILLSSPAHSVVLRTMVRVWLRFRVGALPRL